MPSKLFRNVVIATRVCAIISSIASIVLFIFFFITVSNSSYPTTKPGLTLLPVLALAVSSLGNILSLAITGHVKPLTLLLNDIPAAVLLVTLGTISFVHDDRNYMSNSDWRSWEGSAWLTCEISAFCLMVLTLVAQLLLAVFDVVEHFLKSQQGIPYAVEPLGPPLPTYQGPVHAAKDNEFMLDVQSVPSYDASFKVDMKEEYTKV